MKAGYIVPQNSTRSRKTGQAVARIVTKLGLEKRAFLVSFDPLTSFSAKQENSNLVVGTFYSTSYWRYTAAEYQKAATALGALPGMTSCVSQLPLDRRFMDFLFDTGSMFKAINASFVDMDYTIYNNPMYSNKTFETLKRNYNPKVSAGAWTIYSMKLDATQTEASETRVQNLIDMGAERLITDDVTRLRKKLGRVSSGASRRGSTGMVALIVLLAMFLL